MRTPSIAGTWYPEDPQELLRLVEAEGPRPPELAHPLAIVVPHAGYAYSGPVAARAYARLPPGDYDRAIILAPSHCVALGMTFSVEPAGSVETPFGPVEFSKALHDELESLPGAKFTPAAHPYEHAVDIQLPLLKHFLPDCQVGAAIVGQWTARTKDGAAALASFAAAFRKLMTPRTLVVISSDFTHYGRDFGYLPFSDDVQKRLPALDSDMFAALAKNDIHAWEDALADTGATICGASPLRLLLAALPESARFERLEYATSADRTGDWSHVVGYLSAAVYGEAKGDGLSTQAGKALVEAAWRALREAVTGDGAAVGAPLPPGVEAELARPCGAFVTLTEHGMLRGCIGMITSDEPLLRTVREMAVSAALHDPRFLPVRADELASIELEVSVLTEPVEVSGPEEIVAGRDGVILRKRGRSAVFLPQVATEQGWNVPTMLAHLSQKAGLASDAWREGASFQTFRARIFR